MRRIIRVAMTVEKTADHWDIFCRVVDNFGDAAVSWRLAHQLALEHGCPVRLWIDHLPTLARLQPRVDPELTDQAVEGVEVRRWDDSVDRASPGRVVIDAFGCGLPDAYADRLDERSLWVTLEYLSAEPWVTGCHGLPSPHPRLSVSRYFFFPGFTAGTGGVLRECDLVTRREAHDALAVGHFWESVGFPMPSAVAAVVSLFAYENPMITRLVGDWIASPDPVVAAVPVGLPLALACAAMGEKPAPVGSMLRKGSLELRVLPFLPQPQYDELLWSCHCNFVRGEDSFVRAQWAALPFVWQAYPQADEAHSAKIDAFLSLYRADLPGEVASRLARCWGAWNGIAGREVPGDSIWPDLAEILPELTSHARGWAARLDGLGDLAANLADFCRGKLK